MAFLIILGYSKIVTGCVAVNALEDDVYYF